jgi:hypothetical protein
MIASRAALCRSRLLGRLQRRLCSQWYASVERAASRVAIAPLSLVPFSPCWTVVSLRRYTTNRRRLSLLWSQCSHANLWTSRRSPSLLLGPPSRCLLRCLLCNGTAPFASSQIRRRRSSQIASTELGRWRSWCIAALHLDGRVVRGRVGYAAFESPPLVHLATS